MDPEEFKIEDVFGYALHHASYIFKASMKDQFRDADINVTPEEFIFLFLIPEEGAPQSILTKKTLKDKTTVTRLVDRMVAKGWVRRIENDKNRREQLIFTTPGGREIKQKIMPLTQKFLSIATKGMAADEIERTRQTLNKIIENLSS